MPNSSTQKLAQFRQEILRTFFLEKVTAIKSLSRHRCGGLLSPSGEHVPQGADCILCTPEDMKWTFDLSAGRFVGFVHFQVDVRGGSEILTRSVDRSWIRESTYTYSFISSREIAPGVLFRPPKILRKKNSGSSPIICSGSEEGHVFLPTEPAWIHQGLASATLARADA
jgi:hypothetical protein